VNLYLGYTNDTLRDSSIQSIQSLTLIDFNMIVQGTLPSKTTGSCKNTPATGPSCFINTGNFFEGSELLQTLWTGFKYSIAPTLDVIGAYYHFWNDQFGPGAAGAAAAGGFPKGSGGALALACAVNPNVKAQCAGTVDAISGVIDWRFAPKWDAYFGMMFSQVNGGQYNGNGGPTGTSYWARNNLDPTVGLRLRF